MFLAGLLPRMRAWLMPGTTAVFVPVALSLVAATSTSAATFPPPRTANMSNYWTSTVPVSWTYPDQPAPPPCSVIAWEYLTSAKPHGKLVWKAHFGVATKCAKPMPTTLMPWLILETYKQKRPNDVWVAANWDNPPAATELKGGGQCFGNCAFLNGPAGAVQEVNNTISNITTLGVKYQMNFSYELWRGGVQPAYTAGASRAFLIPTR